MKNKWRVAFSAGTGALDLHLSRQTCINPLIAEGQMGTIYSTNRKFKRMFVNMLSIFVILAMAFPVTGNVSAQESNFVPALAESNITVNTSEDELNEDGDCSLREAIQAANNDTATDACAAGADSDIIGFSENYTITLGSQLPIVLTPITITGNGVDNTIVQANASSDVATYRVFYVAETGALTLNNLTVRNGRCTVLCSIEATDGGGIYNDGGSLTISNATFSNNSAGGGGAIFNSGTVSITNSTFFSNSASWAGGIANSGTMAIFNSTFSNNSAWSTGGGISNWNGILTVSDSTFFANSQLGIYNYLGTATISSSTFSNNTSSAYGGGIYNNAGTMMVTNSTFSGNTTSSYGGGIANDGTLVVSNSTFSGNGALFGGGISNEGTGVLHLKNSILANSTSGGDCLNYYATLATNMYNLIEDNSCDPTLNGDANLGPLADNGGPTQTHALLPGSPAIDAGNPDGCTNDAGNMLEADQRGEPRPIDGNGDGNAVCDIGAYEAEASAAITYIVNTTDDLDDGTCDESHCSLREAINAANANPGLDMVTFDIPGDPPLTIQPQSALPDIYDPVVVDGISQPGFEGSPIIELDGTSAGDGVNGLVIRSGSSTVQGLVINRFNGSGISLVEGGENTIRGNFIGTDVTGRFALGNGDGVWLGEGTSNNTIGGAMPEARNIISGNNIFGISINHENVLGNFVLGNYIGTDVNGSGAIPNAAGGVVLTLGTSLNQIGGTESGAGNLISGNSGDGVTVVEVGTSDNIVQGNFIGTDAAGTTALGNWGRGILIAGGSTDNLIGGTEASAGNLVSGNGAAGIRIMDVGTTGNKVQGNFIGTEVTGANPLGNGYVGVRLSDGAANNEIGGTEEGAGNIISGNKDSGVLIDGNGTTGNAVQGNFIGTDVTGTTITGPAGPTVGEFTLTVEVACPTYPAETNFDGFVSESEDPLAPWSGASVTFKGTEECDSPEMIGAASLIYRYRLEFAEDTQLSLVSVSGAAFNGPDNVLRVLDENMNVLGSVNTFGGNSFQTQYITFQGVVGKVFYVDEFDTSSTWRFRQSIVINGPSPLGNLASGVSLIGGALDNLIGGTEPGSRNIISGNLQNGVAIFNPGTTGNIVQGNYIGTDITGMQPLGNAAPGVGIGDQAFSNLITGNLISGNKSNGIAIFNPWTIGNILQGNYIGTDVSGTTALPNTNGGVWIGDGASNTLIGGLEEGVGNLVSGNGGDGISINDSGTTMTVIQGNYIGTDATGTASLSNLSNGIVLVNGTHDNLIGGTENSAANIISGNGGDGIIIANPGTTGNTVQGNYVGTDVSGTAALPNGGVGIWIGDGASNTMIGGIEEGVGNLVSGNGGDGISINDSGTTGTIIQGNHIGTDFSGTATLPNLSNGIVLVNGTHDNLIGGNESGARNLISGNLGNGVNISNFGTMGNTVQGNYIGTDVTGTTATGPAGPNPGEFSVTVIDGTCPTYPAETDFEGFVSESEDPLAPWSEISVTFKGTDECTDREMLGAASLVYRYELEFAETTQLTSIMVSGAAFNGPDSVLRVLDNDMNVLAIAYTFGGNSFQTPYITLQGVEGTTFYIDEFDTSSTWRFRQSIIVNGPVPLGNYGNGVLIADSASGNIVDGNVVSGNLANGVGLFNPGTTGNTVQNNYIGTDFTGIQSLGNAAPGVSIGDQAFENQIVGNLISGNNSDGIAIFDPGTSGNTIGGAEPGSGNTIAFNSGRGIAIYNAASGNAILSNSVFSNGGLGIELGEDGVTPNDPLDQDTGPNDLQNFPIITTVTRIGSSVKIQGVLVSAPGTSYRLEFFSNETCDPANFGEGQAFLGSAVVKTNPAGIAHFEITLPVSLPQGAFITATATDPAGNTSEFSNCFSPAPGWNQVNISGFGDPQTTGVTALEVFNNQLYAGASNWNTGGQVWRLGGDGLWQQGSENGFGGESSNPAIIDLAVFQGKLYAGVGWNEAPGQVWSSVDGVDWQPVTTDGFGDGGNTAITNFVVFKGMFYAGTSNTTGSAQIWRSSSGNSGTWIQVAPDGSGLIGNVTGFAVYKGVLYAAIEPAAGSGASIQVWRSINGSDWTTITADGLGDPSNTSTGGFAEFDGYLYLGLRNDGTGGQIWRTMNGIDWQPVVSNGFGEISNVKVESLLVYNDQLYATTYNEQTGIQIWRSDDGIGWEQIAANGFGDGSNFSTLWNSATVEYQGQLLIGTWNNVEGGELWMYTP